MLRTELRTGFAQVGGCFDKTDGRLDRIDQRLNAFEHQIFDLRQGAASSGQVRRQLLDDVKNLSERVDALERMLAY